MRSDDLITPIRTRGPIRVREAEETPGPSETEIPTRGGLQITPIRTRGAIRIREPEAVPVPSEEPIRTRGARGAETRREPARPPIAIQALVKEMRERSTDLPLSVVIYGWGRQEAQEFASRLRPHLRPEDAMIVRPSRHPEASVMASVPGGAVLLDLDRPSHRCMLENGVGDIVFFGGPEEWPAKKEVERWADSAQAVIVKKGAPEADAILRAAHDSQLLGYVWLGDSVQPA